MLISFAEYRRLPANEQPVFASVVYLQTLAISEERWKYKANPRNLTVEKTITNGSVNPAPLCPDECGSGCRSADHRMGGYRGINWA